MAGRRHQGTSDAILDAASRLLADEGPHALTVRRIAAEAGGSTMNVYSRFGSKDGIVEALYLEGFRRLRAAMVDAPTTDDPVADLTACGQAYRRFALENPTYYSVMFEGTVPDFEASEEAAIEARGTLLLLAERVRRVMDAGRFERRDEYEVATSLWAVNHGLVSLQLKQAGPPDIDWEALHTTTLAAMSRGLAPAKGQPERPRRK